MAGSDNSKILVVVISEDGSLFRGFVCSRRLKMIKIVILFRIVLEIVTDSLVRIRIGAGTWQFLSFLGQLIPLVCGVTRA